MREIWRHSAAEWGSARAEEYLADILSAFDLLCERPRIGTQRKRRRRTYRRWPINSHAIFYRVEGRQIGVIRILHCRMKENLHLP
ncbi:type II toxin-antitoxin system RelE/ParE family toxin [Sphingomonas sp. DT-207]|uniref:type II toxin-antitoxin system RelE/ParE family toxin n=1 Tax=Sphingomonas sp. DT-207 TaxID=3396167 RepID=UPI003F1D355D